jgi:hypothetical protein
MLHRVGQFHYQSIHRFIIIEEFCKKVLFFDNCGRLQALKGSNAEKRKFQDVWKDVINGDFCSKAGPDIYTLLF